MPSKIKYAYLKEQTWMFRRNYPQDVALVLGSQALKQSLKTGDPKLAAARAAPGERFNLRDLFGDRWAAIHRGDPWGFGSDFHKAVTAGLIPNVAFVEIASSGRMNVYVRLHD